VTCLFVAKESRGDGVSTALLKAAAKHVKKSGGRIVEGYPVEPSGRQPAAWLFTGIASAYVKAGFTEVARRSPTRPIMRFHLAK
jgi:GNAT superfamily N-acetyltransferase